MHKLLRSTLMANSAVITLLLVSNWAFAEPLPLQLSETSETSEQSMLDTRSVHSQYLYQARLQPDVAASDEQPMAQILESQWITAPQPPVQLDKTPTPGLRF